MTAGGANRHVVIACLVAAVCAGLLVATTAGAEPAGNSGRKPATVNRCRPFGLAGPLRAASVRKERHVRCRVVRRLLRGTYNGGGYRHTYPWHDANGTPYGRATTWFRKGWRCTTGAGGAVCWNVGRPRLNAIESEGGRPLAIAASVR